MFRVLTVLLLALALLATACSKDTSPKGVCEQVGKLAESEGGEYKKLWDDELSKSCEKQMESMKKAAGDDAFKQFAECVYGKEKFSETSECEKPLKEAMKKKAKGE